MIEDLRTAYAAYEQARKQAEEPNGEFRIDLADTFRAPTAEEYAGYQIKRHGSAQAALAAMQGEGRKVNEEYMDGIARQTAAIIAKAIKEEY